MLPGSAGERRGSPRARARDRGGPRTAWAPSGGNRGKPKARRNPRASERSASSRASPGVNLSMRAPTGSLPVVHGPLRARRRLRARPPARLPAYPRDFGILGRSAVAIHRRSTTRVTEVQAWVRSARAPDPGPATALPSDRSVGSDRPPGTTKCPEEPPLLSDPSCPLYTQATCPCEHRRDQQVSRPLWARPNVGDSPTPPEGTYPRVSKFEGPFRADRPHPVHENRPQHLFCAGSGLERPALRADMGDR